MSRSRDYDSEDYLGPQPQRPSETSQEEDVEKPDPGRGAGESSTSTGSHRREEYERLSRNVDRQAHRDLDRSYLLRESEVAALIEIGKFRAIQTKDLVEVLYQNDSERAGRDLRNLTAQGLIKTRTLNGTEKEQLLTITQSAKEFLGRANPVGLGKKQKLHHGFVKPREARHDSMIYRLYEKAAQKIEEEGGTKLRVVLDYELKRDLYRDLATLKSLSPAEQEAKRSEIAEEHGLKVVNGKIPLPDLRIEYETQDHEHARIDLELATRAYRGQHLSEKAKAGFSIYASAQDAPRLRAALQDPHLISEILSL
jgi:hypothetical protein